MVLARCDPEALGNGEVLKFLKNSFLREFFNLDQFTFWTGSDHGVSRVFCVLKNWKMIGIGMTVDSCTEIW